MHQSNHNHSVVSSITWEGDSEQTVVIEDGESVLKWERGACNWMPKTTGEVAGMKTRPSPNRCRSAYFSASSSESELHTEQQMHTVASFPSLVVRNDEKETSTSSTRMPMPVSKPIERPPPSISIPYVPIVPLQSPPEPFQRPCPLTASFRSAYPLSETILHPIATPLLPVIPSTSPLIPSPQDFDLMPEHIAPLLVIPVGVASQLAKTFGHQQEEVRRRTGIGKAVEEDEEDTLWLSGDYKHISDVCGCDPRAWRSPSKFCLLLRPAEVSNGSNIPDVGNGADVLLPVRCGKNGTSTLKQGKRAIMSMNPTLQKIQEHIELFVESGPHIGVMPKNIAVVSGMERSGIISLHAHLSMRDMCLHIRKCISRPSVLLEAAFSGKSLWEVSEDEGRITLSEKNESKLLLWTSGKDFQNQDGDVVGIWFRGSTDVRHPRLWSICEQLLSDTHSEAPFIVILAPPECTCSSSTDPLPCLECYEVQAHSSGRGNVVSLDFRTVIDSSILGKPPPDMKDDMELTVVGRFRPTFCEHPGLQQESILPGQRKKGVDNILCGVAPCSVSPVNPRYCDLSQDEGPDNLSQRPLTNTRNGISTLDTNRLVERSSVIRAPVCGSVLNLSIEELNTLDATARKVFLKQQKQLLVLQEQLEELRADVRSSHDMALSVMRASISTLSAPASAGITEPVERSVTHCNLSLFTYITTSAELLAAAINHLSNGTPAPFKDRGGRLDVGNATKESIAPVLAPNHISLSKTSLSCVDAETNTSLLLNAEPPPCVSPTKMVAPAWGGHHVHGEETDGRLDIGERDGQQYRHTIEEGKSVVEFEERCLPNDIPICGLEQQATPQEDDSVFLGEVGSVFFNNGVTPAVAPSSKRTSSSLNIEGPLIDEPLLLRTERLLKEIPTIRYSMHSNSDKNVIASKTDEEALSLEHNWDEGNTLVEIEVKYLCCPTASE